MVDFGTLTSQSWYGAPWWVGYVVLGLAVVLILRGAMRTTRGVRIIGSDSILIRPAVLLALYALAILGTLAAGWGTSYLAAVGLSVVLDAVAIAAGFALAGRWVLSSLTMQRRAPSMDYYYTVSAIVPVVYVVLFVLRAAVEAAVLGALPFTVPSTLTGVPAVQLAILIVVDLAWGVSTGLALGRSWAIRTEYRRRSRADAGGAQPPSVA